MDIFDPATRAKLKTLTLEGGKSLDSRGTDVNHVLSDLPATSAQLADAAGDLDRSQEQLDALTLEFDHIAAEMAAEDTNLRGDLRNGASLLDTIAARRAAAGRDHLCQPGPRRWPTPASPATSRTSPSC